MNACHRVGSGSLVGPLFGLVLLMLLPIILVMGSPWIVQHICRSAHTSPRTEEGAVGITAMGVLILLILVAGVAGVNACVELFR